MANQMAATAMTLNDLEGHSPVAGLFKRNLSNIYAAFYTISTDSGASCSMNRETTCKEIVYARNTESG